MRMYCISSSLFVADHPTLLLQIRDFASGWRAGIQQMNDDVLLYFSSFHSGMEILKQVRSSHRIHLLRQLTCSAVSRS